MMIAIFGGSCTGKTVIATELAQQTNLPLRNCGQEIKSLAKQKGVSLNNLPMEIHQYVDRETIEFSLRTLDCIVEGRYLNFVLSDFPLPIFSVELITDQDKRLERFAKRIGSHNISQSLIDQEDACDDKFKTEMYKDICPLKPNIVINNSRVSITECADQINLWRRFLL